MNVFILDFIDCSESLLGPEAYNILYNYIFLGIKYAVPALLVILIMKDLFTAVAAGDEKQIKKAQSDAIKRIIAGVIIMLLPTIVNVILSIVGIANGVC